MFGIDVGELLRDRLALGKRLAGVIGVGVVSRGAEGYREARGWFRGLWKGYVVDALIRAFTCSASFSLLLYGWSMPSRVKPLMRGPCGF